MKIQALYLIGLDIDRRSADLQIAMNYAMQQCGVDRKLVIYGQSAPHSVPLAVALYDNGELRVLYSEPLGMNGRYITRGHWAKGSVDTWKNNRRDCYWGYIEDDFEELENTKRQAASDDATIKMLDTDFVIELERQPVC